MSSGFVEENNTTETNQVKLGAPLFNNLEKYHHPISTHSPLAQRFFDQGMVLFYGFDFGESIRSFREATRLDPSCAMCYWGLALALGSKNNMPLNGNERQDGLTAIKKAQQLVDPKNPKESAYIQALSKRYSSNLASGQGSSAEVLTMGASSATPGEAQDYADAMRDVVQQFPKDIDAKDLYVFALFDVNKWHFWTRDGKPQPNTLEMIKTLQSALTIDRNNLAANHFFIHVMEQSPHPETALSSANFFRDSVGLIGLHMPGNIYLPTGHYNEATLANQKAVAAYLQYQVDSLAQGFEPEINYLYLHSLDLLRYSSMMEGRSFLAIKTAEELVKQTQIPWVKRDNYLQIFLPALYFAKARFGKWNEILSEPKSLSEFQYAVGMWHYARGLSYVHLNKYNESENELAQLRKITQQGAIEKNMGVLGESLLNIAQEILAASIEDRKKNKAAVLKHLEKAIQLQNRQDYTQPPAWYFPIQEMLGYELLKMGNAAEAEIAFKEDLRQNPNNGWALFGLEKSLRLQGKDNEAKKTQEQFKKAWNQADIILPINEL